VDRVRVEPVKLKDGNWVRLHCVTVVGQRLRRGKQTVYETDVNQRPARRSDANTQCNV